MSDTPSPIPSDTLKPRLSLTPKVAAAPAPASVPAPAAPPAASTLEVNPEHPSQSSSTVTPPGLTAAIAAGASAPRPVFKLQGADNVHPANPEKFGAAKFTSPMPATIDGAPSPVVVALSAIAAVAALAFAALLFLKTQ